MILELFEATITPGKEKEAIEEFRKTAQLINKICGTQKYRVMQPQTGLTQKLLLVGEMESHAVREEYIKMLDNSEEWLTFSKRFFEKECTEINSTIHHFYTIFD